RFLSGDTFRGQIADPSSLNRYAYARQDPVDRVDPSGHDFVLAALELVVDALDDLSNALDKIFRYNVNLETIHSIEDALFLTNLGLFIATSLVTNDFKAGFAFVQQAFDRKAHIQKAEIRIFYDHSGSGLGGLGDLILSLAMDFNPPAKFRYDVNLSTG